MVIDEENQKNNDLVIEILVDDMWTPAMATDLRILNRASEFRRVTAIRVRDMGKEK